MIDDFNISVYGQTMYRLIVIRIWLMFSALLQIFGLASPCFFITLFSLLLLSSFMPWFLTTASSKEAQLGRKHKSMIVDCCMVVSSSTRSVVNVFCLKPIHPSHTLLRSVPLRVHYLWCLIWRSSYGEGRDDRLQSQCSNKEGMYCATDYQTIEWMQQKVERN